MNGQVCRRGEEASFRRDATVYGMRSGWSGNRGDGGARDRKLKSVRMVELERTVKGPEHMRFESLRDASRELPGVFTAS
jgi:hypothetical protein